MRERERPERCQVAFFFLLKTACLIGGIVESKQARERARERQRERERERARVRERERARERERESESERTRARARDLSVVKVNFFADDNVLCQERFDYFAHIVLAQ